MQDSPTINWQCVIQYFPLSLLHCQRPIDNALNWQSIIQFWLPHDVLLISLKKNPEKCVNSPTIKCWILQLLSTMPHSIFCPILAALSTGCWQCAKLTKQLPTCLHYFVLTANVRVKTFLIKTKYHQLSVGRLSLCGARHYDNWSWKTSPRTTCPWQLTFWLLSPHISIQTTRPLRYF